MSLHPHAPPKRHWICTMHWHDFDHLSIRIRGSRRNPQCRLCPFPWKNPFRKSRGKPNDLASIFFRQAFGTLDLCAGLKTALPAGANPLHGITSFGNKSCLGTPGDDKLPSPSTTRHTMNDCGLFCRMMSIHQLDKSLDLLVGRHPVVRDVNEMIGELLRHILPVIELTNIYD